MGTEDQLPLILDIQGAQSQLHPERGIARYVFELSKALWESNPERIHAIVANARLGMTDAVRFFAGTGKLAWNNSSGDHIIPPRRRFGYYQMSPFELAGFEEQLPRYARSSEALTIVTAFDFIPLRFPEQYLSDPDWNARYTTRLSMVRDADAVLAISESTARDTVELVGATENRVSVIGTGVSTLFRPSADRAQALAELQDGLTGIRPGFIFSVAGVDSRKNLGGLLKAYSGLPRSMRQDHQLVVTCRLSDQQRADILATASDLGIESDLLLTGTVADGTLLRLYQTTRLFVFPSLWEGFGLPLAEALACGAPAICSDRGALPEVLPRRECQFDPENSTEVTEAIANALQRPTDQLESKELGDTIVERFSWQRVATRALKAIDEMQADAQRRRFTVWNPHPRWAFVMSTQSSMELRKNTELAKAIAQHVDLDVFVADLDDTDAPGPYVTRRLADLAAWDSFMPYDAVVYCNSADEIPTAVHEVMGRSQRKLTLVNRELPHETADHLLSLGGLIGVFSSFFADHLTMSGAQVRVVELPVGLGSPSGFRPPRIPGLIALLGQPTADRLGLMAVNAARGGASADPPLRFVISSVGRQTEVLMDTVEQKAASGRVELIDDGASPERRLWMNRAAGAIQWWDPKSADSVQQIEDCLSSALPTMVVSADGTSPFPEGVVRNINLPSSTEEFRVTAAGFVADRRALAELADGARGYAQQNSFDALADRIIDLLELSTV
ncbi:MAG: glycosyltransferase family 1 protein [Acidimicrobiia bacterium]